MAGTVSPATGRRYGVARVCRAWDVPRSSCSAARRETGDVAPARPRGRRGPKPAVSDADLVAAIRADLARSPWSGEGHRKVWAWLRVQDGLRLARKRVLRLMRENGLLSPHRARTRPGAVHDRRISSPMRRTSCGPSTARRSPPCRTARSGSSPQPSTGTPRPSAGT